MYYSVLLIYGPSWRAVQCFMIATILDLRSAWTTLDDQRDGPSKDYLNRIMVQMPFEKIVQAIFESNSKINIIVAATLQFQFVSVLRRGYLGIL